MFAVTRYLKIKDKWYLEYYKEFLHKATLKRFFKMKGDLPKDMKIKIEDLKTGKEL